MRNIFHRDTIVSAAMAMAGVVCSYAALSIYTENRQFLKTARIVEGRVIREVMGDECPVNPSAKVMVSIRGPDGEERYMGIDCQCGYEEGERVRIAHGPGNPKNARILSFWELNASVVGLSAFGLLLVGLGAWLTALCVRSNR